MNTSFASREYPDFQLYLLSISGASVEGERFIKDLGIRQDVSTIVTNGAAEESDTELGEKNIVYYCDDEFKVDT